MLVAHTVHPSHPHPLLPYLCKTMQKPACRLLPVWVMVKLILLTLPPAHRHRPIQRATLHHYHLASFRHPTLLLTLRTYPPHCLNRHLQASWIGGELQMARLPSTVCRLCLCLFQGTSDLFLQQLFRVAQVVKRVQPNSPSAAVQEAGTVMDRVEKQYAPAVPRSIIDIESSQLPRLRRAVMEASLVDRCRLSRLYRAKQ